MLLAVLALVAIITFVLATVFFFVNMTEVLNGMSTRSKKLNDLRAQIELAEKGEDYKRVEELEKELQSLSLGFLGNFLYQSGGCCLYLIVGMGLQISELVIMVTALTTKVGDPLYGYIALAAWATTLIYSYVISPAIIKREIAEAQKIGNVYLAKRNWFWKVFGMIPDVYALYVFLVLIGAITFSR